MSGLSSYSEVPREPAGWNIENQLYFKGRVIFFGDKEPKESRLKGSLKDYRDLRNLRLYFSKTKFWVTKQNLFHVLIRVLGDRIYIIGV